MRLMHWIVFIGFVVATTSLASSASAAPHEAAAALIRRIVPAAADGFILETIPAADGHDVFEIDHRDGKIVVRGNSGVAIASGWHWYLKHYCRCHVSLWGDNMALPKQLPPPAEKIRRTSPFKHRYYLNFCAFSYSLPWYDWPRWQRLIDWMALNGVNMPLAVTGQEAVWRQVYGELGLSRRQLDDYFVGPAYLPFGSMGCIDGWGGPLSDEWIDAHAQLQKQIVARERELGMTPVLQGFTGHVPPALKERFPQAKLLRLPSWCGFPPTSFLDPQDPLFREIGRRFIAEQTRLFGTDHFYAADTFIEMQPPSDEPEFLSAMGRGVYGAIQAGDPEATWVMQGWMFSFLPQFWRPPQAKALLGAVPDKRMILLDLACEDRPVWSKTEAFYGKPWVWNVIQDYGDVVSLHGGLPQMHDNLLAAIRCKNGKLVGLGMVNEGLGANPAVNDYLAEAAWSVEPPAIESWIPDYIAARYGNRPPQVERAWRTLLETVYRQPGQVGSRICDRPRFMAAKDDVAKYIPYDNVRLVRAWGDMLAAAEQLHAVDAYRFDLVHVGRQALVNMAAPLHQEILLAHENKDRAKLKELSDKYLQLIGDLDQLTGTRRELLLGRWLAEAKSWADDDAQRKHYEWNARSLITLWGPRDSELHDYSRREWSGMFAGFYLPRWKMFFERLEKSLAENRPFDAAACEKQLRDWEESWTRRNDEYPSATSGDEIEVSRRLWAKYAPRQ